MNTVSFFVPGAPRGKQRPRISTRGRHPVAYTPQQTVTEEGAIRLFAQQAMQGRPPFQGPVSVQLIAFMPISQSWAKKKQEKAKDNIEKHTAKPDLDNICKIVFDGINHIVWNDDTQIVDLVAVKRFSLTPGIQMTVTEMPDGR